MKELVLILIILLGGVVVLSSFKRISFLKYALCVIAGAILIEIYHKL